MTTNIRRCGRAGREALTPAMEDVTPAVMIQPASEAAVLALVDRLRAAPPRSADELAAATGAILVRTLRDTWELRAPATGRDGVGYAEVQWRGVPAGGALSVIALADGGPGRAVLEARLGPLESFDAPRSEHPDEEYVFARTESWGELRLGFAQGRPDRLSSIVLDVAAR